MVHNTVQGFSVRLMVSRPGQKFEHSGPLGCACSRASDHTGWRKSSPFAYDMLWGMRLQYELEGRKKGPLRDRLRAAYSSPLPPQLTSKPPPSMLDSPKMFQTTCHNWNMQYQGVSSFNLSGRGLLQCRLLFNEKGALILRAC